MTIRGFNLFSNKNNLNLMQGLGQNPIPMKGLERFMQKRGMNYPGFPQGANFQVPPLQRPKAQGDVGSLSNTLNVQGPPEKGGGIKAFVSQFMRKRSN